MKVESESEVAQSSIKRLPTMRETQITGLLNKANFPFQTRLLSQILAFEMQAAKPKFRKISDQPAINQRFDNLLEHNSQNPRKLFICVYLVYYKGSN